MSYKCKECPGETELPNKFVEIKVDGFKFLAYVCHQCKRVHFVNGVAAFSWGEKKVYYVDGKLDYREKEVSE